MKDKRGPAHTVESVLDSANLIGLGSHVRAAQGNLAPAFLEELGEALRRAGLVGASDRHPLEELANLVEPGLDWRLEGDVLVAAELLEVVHTPTDERISELTVEALAGVTAALRLRPSLFGDGALEALVAALRQAAEVAVQTRNRQHLESYRRGIELDLNRASSGIADRLADRDRFPLPHAIGQWCLGSDPSGALYYTRNGDALGPVVWATPGGESRPELLVQIDPELGAGALRSRWILVPWTLDPRLDAALFAAALRRVLEELEPLPPVGPRLVAA